MTAIAFLRRIRGTRSPFLYKESLCFWCEAMRSELTILPPQGLASKENIEADYLNRHCLQRWTSNYWNPVTCLFPLVPLIPLAQEKVQKQHFKYVSHDVVGITLSAFSKYYITDSNTSLTVGKESILAVKTSIPRVLWHL